MKLKDIILAEGVNINLDTAYELFNKSYIEQTGKSWDKEKFLDRAKNWEFFGNEKGYIAIRVQRGGMIKLVGVSGSPMSVYRGFLDMKDKYASRPIWCMVSPKIGTYLEKMGFKQLKIPMSSMADKLIAKLFVTVIKTIIPKAVIGGAEIGGINNDGTIHFTYEDIGEVNKVLVGNKMYYEELKNKILSHEKIPTILKNRIISLIDALK